MNPELRRILLILVETGCNAVEILRMPVERMMVDAKIPHIIVDNLEGDSEREHGTLKANARIRAVPLVGVALNAAKALKADEGVKRYWDGSDNFSAAANKFLRDSGLQQEKRSTYGLRHAIVKAPTNDPNVSDDLRRAIMGCKGKGSHEENYAEFSLERKLHAMQKIALPFDPNSLNKL
ncbi:hypothetical protein [Roseibium sp.]|uniref:hypothetical protein n=1 Tax=Roseibium sp. TaxID=1936156 RepID=UPI003BABE1A3